jgi:hypothetical protein
MRLAGLCIGAVAATGLAACGGGGSSSVADASSAAAGSIAASSAASTSSGGASATTTSAATHWMPVQTDTWQWQLTGAIDTSYQVGVYDIDLFDAPQSVIDSLKAQGRRVVCYFSAGTAENWRSDYSRFLPSDLGNSVQGWSGERWVDTRSTNVRNIMSARLDLAVSKGCDGVEPDNVDGYTNNPGLPLDSSTQADFNLFIANAAHARHLAVALKNDIEQLGALGASFDFAVNEQCHAFNECSAYGAFLASGKAVFNAEYASKYVQNTGGARDQLCQTAKTEHLRTLVLPQALNDSFRFSCD